MLNTIDRFASRARAGLRALPMLAAAGTLAALGAPAEAALIGSLSFSAPTGTAGPSDSIPIYLTLTLDAASDALTTDSSRNITSGVTDADWLAVGIDPEEIGYTYLNITFQCGGTFGALCDGDTPYGISFGSSLNAPSDFDLQPGQSLQFLYGTFAPTAAPVPAGTYTFYNAGITANALDKDGNPFVDEEGDRLPYINLFQTCPSRTPDCAFTRTVSGVEAAVPEPASWAMMLSGFGAIGYSLRRRPRRMQQAV